MSESTVQGAPRVPRDGRHKVTVALEDEELRMLELAAASRRATGAIPPRRCTKSAVLRDGVEAIFRREVMREDF